MTHPLYGVDGAGGRDGSARVIWLRITGEQQSAAIATLGFLDEEQPRGMGDGCSFGPVCELQQGRPAGTGVRYQAIAITRSGPYGTEVAQSVHMVYPPTMNSAQIAHRGRPRAFDADAARTRIAQAFWDGGYDGTSLDQLTASTGLSKSSLYAAFGNKEAMYIEAMRHFASVMGALILPALDAAGSLRSRLLNAYSLSIEHYLSDGRGRGCLVLCTAPAAAAASPAIAAMLRDIFRGAEELMTDRFRTASSELRPGVDPHDAALLAIAVQHAIADRARAGEAKDDLVNFAHRAVGAMPWA